MYSRKTRSLFGIFSLALVIVLVLLVAGCGNSTSTTTTAGPATTAGPGTTATPTTAAPSSDTTASAPITIKVGSLAALTGFFSAADTQNDRELRMMADIINEQGGLVINGQKYVFEIATEDTKSDVAGVKSAAELLVDNDKVKYAVETIGFFAVSANDVFEQAQVLHVNDYPTLLPDEINANTPYKFAGTNGYPGNIVAALAALKQNYPNVKTFVYAQPDDGTQKYAQTILTDAASRVGLTQVGDIVTFANDAVDMNATATKIGLAKADAVIMTGMPAAAGGTFKALRTSGVTSPCVYVGATSAADMTTVTGKDAANDIITLGVFPDDPNNPPVLTEIYKRIIAKYGSVSFTGEFANCLYVIDKAMEKAQSVEPAAVKAALETMGTIDTIYGTGTLCGTKTYGTSAPHGVAHPCPVTLIKNGVGSSGGWVKDTVYP